MLINEEDIDFIVNNNSYDYDGDEANANDESDDDDSDDDDSDDDANSDPLSRAIVSVSHQAQGLARPRCFTATER